MPNDSGVIEDHPSPLSAEVYFDQPEKPKIRWLVCGLLFLRLPSTTVVGISGAVGAAGGAIFTWIVNHFFSLHPLLIFALAASAYLIAFAIFHFLVPRLGQTAKLIEFPSQQA